MNFLFERLRCFFFYIHSFDMRGNGEESVKLWERYFIVGSSISTLFFSSLASSAVRCAGREEITMRWKFD